MSPAEDGGPYFVSEILIASSNQNKVMELQQVGSRYALTLLSPQSIRATRDCGEEPIVAETGLSYLENALLKARAHCSWSGGCVTLGDDSGLEVDILGGAPGIHSARYAGEGATDSLRISRLLEAIREEEQQQGKRERRARFRSVLVLYYPNGAWFQAEGVLEGEIVDSPTGDKGFGYDPIVYIPLIGATLAEVDFSVTCKQGFRAQAAERLFTELCSLRRGKER